MFLSDVPTGCVSSREYPQKTSHIHSDTRNKCGVRRPSHLNQSKEKLSNVCFKRTASYLLWPLALNSIRFQNGYPATKISYFLNLAKTEPATAMKHAFSTDFTCSQPAEYPFTPSAKHLIRKDVFSKPKGLFPLLCPIQLRTVFGRVSTAAAEVFASDIVREKHTAQLSLTLSLPHVAENDTFAVG